MQISIRSHLIAGTAAALGAAAVAIAPAPTSAGHLPALPSAAQVALAGFDSPITELIGTLGLLGNTLFNGDDAPEGLPEVYIGLVPDFIAQQLPIISQLGYNGSDYLNFTLNALGFAATTLSEAVWNLPEAVIDAGEQLIAGEITDALGTLIEATFVPVQTAASAALGAGVYVFDGVLRRASAVAALIPSLVGGLAQNLLDNASVLVRSVTAIVDGVTSGISSGDFAQAWNAVVDGLLGPTGLPGALINATIGLGNGSGKDFVPSLRTAVTKGVQDVAEALTTPVVPGAAVRAAAPAAAAVAAPERSLTSSAVRSAAAVAVPDTTAAPEASPAPSEDAAGNDATAKESPAKQRVSRKAAGDR